MLTNPLVTILMTVYNGSEYLETSVQSILNQTFKDFEFLIINDCSTDDSIKIIESFNDKRIIIHNNEKNLGQTKSLNIGLELAKGKYIARMDADDMACPIWLEKLVNYIKEHPEYAAVGSTAIVIDSIGKRKKLRRVPVNFHEIIFRIFFDSPMNHVSVLLNRDLILENGGYDEEFKITQDYELWSSLVRNNYSIINIPDVLVSYRVHSSSKGFMEANKRCLEEKSETIFRNINSLTNMKVKLGDAIGLCKLFYHTPDLHPEEFDRAQTNFENIYSNMKDKFTLPPRLIKSGIKAQMLKPYCKLAISEIQNNKTREARKIVLRYCSRYGFHIIPFLIFLITFAGLGISKRIQIIYEKSLRMTTEISLKFKLTTLEKKLRLVSRGKNT